MSGEGDETGAVGAEEVTHDGFYDGRFVVAQPKDRGYRSGLDALLLAASVPVDATGRLADVGSGAGVVGLAALDRARGLHVTLIEKNATMAALAREGRDLPVNAPVAARIAVVEADILAPWPGGAQGLEAGGFDWVATNPPFHAAGGRRPDDPLRADALFADGPDFLHRWLRASAALLKGGGAFSTILRADALGAVLAALDGRIGGLRLLPIHPAVDRPASRIVIAGTKGSRAPSSLLAGAVLTDADGRPSAFAAEVAAGRATIA